jgi:hypothetical protein
MDMPYELSPCQSYTDFTYNCSTTPLAARTQAEKLQNFSGGVRVSELPLDQCRSEG